MITFLRWISIAVCSVFMLGFGICGAFGLIGGTVARDAGALLMMGVPGAIGLGLAYGCFRLIRALAKSDQPGQPERGD